MKHETKGDKLVVELTAEEAAQLRKVLGPLPGVGVTYDVYAAVANFKPIVPQKFTIEVEISTLGVKRGGEVNIHQVNNHVRKYVAADRGIPIGYVKGTAKPFIA